jgi:hypothetical protein
MERTSSVSVSEIVGIAAATAAALGGVIVALGRSQSDSRRVVDAVRTAAALPVVSAVQDKAQPVERGRHLMHAASSFVADVYPEVLHGASDLLHRASETTRPQVEKAASLASTQAGRARASGNSVVERVQESLVPTAAAALGALAERATEARERAQPVASDAVAASAARADVAVAKTSSAARESLALVVWTTLAASLIYLVLLDAERRERVRTFLFNAFDQGRLLVQDFQGYEEDI